MPDETCPEIAREGTPSRRKVEASCEVVYAQTNALWPSWKPSEALWEECLGADLCRRARMCVRQRRRQARIMRARNALALARRLGAVLRE